MTDATVSGAGEPAQMQHGQSQFIPVLKHDLIEALSASFAGGGARDFRTFASFLSAYYHHHYYEQLSTLKEAHAWFAPSGPKPVRQKPLDLETTYRAMSATFEDVMVRANFVEVPQAQVQALGGDHPLLDVKTRTPMEAYESVRIFVRGGKAQTIERHGSLFKRGAATIADVFDDVVVYIRFKPQTADEKRRVSWFSKDHPANAPAGSVLIKYFRNIARPELPMLLPEVQIVMNRKDMLLLGGPALLGGVPVAMNIVPALSVLLVVIGAYLGFQGVADQNQMTKALAALSALAGAGAFMFRQYSNYAHRKLKYRQQLADNIYFKNINNDAGVFESLIGAAEDQETKEALLAYVFLAKGPVATAHELDLRIEAWLKQTFGLDIDFEVSDALSKLERLGLLTHEDGKIGTLAVREGLARLDTLWDQLYDFPRPERAHAAA